MSLWWCCRWKVWIDIVFFLNDWRRGGVSINIFGVKCSVSSRSLLVDFWVDVYSFLNNIKLNSRLAASNIPWWHLYRIQHEMRGRELVRTVNPQLVSAVTFFKRIFWNSESDKNYISSKILSFTMMLLVLSWLSCLKLAEFRLRRSSLKVLFIS